MKDTSRMFVSVFAAAVVFLLLFLLLRWNLIVCILLCTGVYFGLFLLFRPNRKIAGIDVEALPGGEEIQQLLIDAQTDLAELDKAVKKIADPAVRRDAETLAATGVKILSYLRENPDKIRRARRFFTYYLDTAAKLLARYVDFQDTGLHSPEISDILKKTAAALPVLNSAFETQFTHLMQGELLDVEADIEVLKSALELEGGK